MKRLREKFLEFLEEKRRNKLFRIIGPPCIDSFKTYDELVSVIKRKAPFTYLWRGQNKKDSSQFSEDLLNLGIVKEYFKDEGSNSKFSIQQQKTVIRVFKPMEKRASCRHVKSTQGWRR